MHFLPSQTFLLCCCIAPSHVQRGGSSAFMCKTALEAGISESLWEAVIPENPKRLGQKLNATRTNKKGVQSKTVTREERENSSQMFKTSSCRYYFHKSPGDFTTQKICRNFGRVACGNCVRKKTILLTSHLFVQNFLDFFSCRASCRSISLRAT